MTNAGPYDPRPDRATLEPLVRAALADERASVTDWTIAPVGYAADTRSPINGGVYRARGTAAIGSEQRAWSLIIKVVHSPAGLPIPEGGGAVFSVEVAEDANGFSYWQREPLAYCSGLLADLPAGISAPRCYAVSEP